MNKILRVIFHIVFSSIIIAAVFFIEKDRLEFSFSRKLCDGFFVSSVLLFAYFGFAFISRGGLFDSFSFTVKKLFNKTKSQNYFDYVRQKNSNKKNLHIITAIFAVIEFIAALVLSF